VLLNTVLEILAGAISQEKEMKGIQTWEENPKDSTRKLLDLINTFSNVAVHKINMENSVAFVYTNYEHTEREMRKTIPFTRV
jgi:hypothetical protein